MRACALSRGLENCGACGEYGTCSKIGGFLAMVPAAKTNLDGYRAARR
jgi:hypothetical protein